MNRRYRETGGSVLLVSQFTLLADLKKGPAAFLHRRGPPDRAAPMFDRFVEGLREAGGIPTETGRFGARMEVSLVNDGPVTLVLDVRGGRVV